MISFQLFWTVSILMPGTSQLTRSRSLCPDSWLSAKDFCAVARADRPLIALCRPSRSITWVPAKMWSFYCPTQSETTCKISSLFWVQTEDLCSLTDILEGRNIWATSGWWLEVSWSRLWATRTHGGFADRFRTWRTWLASKTACSKIRVCPAQMLCSSWNQSQSTACSTSKTGALIYFSQN